MRPFNRLNYTTIHKSSGDLGEFPLTESACFSRLFRPIRNTRKVLISQDYSIYVDLTSTLNLGYHNNFCILGINTIKRYLRALQLVVPFKWKLTLHDTDFEGRDLLRVDLALSRATRIQHLFLLTSVRYIYEYPFNVILSDAYKLKDMSKYKFDSIVNLYQLCAISFPGNYNLGHSLSIPTRYSLNKELGEELENRKRTKLMDLMFIKNSRGLKFNKFNKSEEIYDLGYWRDPEEFEIRLETYNKNYEKWRKKSM